MMTSAMVMELIVKTLDTRMGKDIKVLKTDAITPLADYFVICTATTTSHIRTLSDEVAKTLAENGETPLRREGLRTGGWVLLDFGCVIVHVFLEETRSFYELERLWSDAPQIDITPIVEEEEESEE